MADFLQTIKKKLDDGIYSSRSKLYGNASKRFKSPIWEIVNEILDENRDLVKNAVVCTKCNKVFVYNSNSHGTSHILKHSCMNSNASNTLISGFLTVQNKKIRSDDKLKIKQAATSFICKDLRPFEALNGSGLLEFASACVNIGAIYGNLAIDDIKNLLPSPQTVSRFVSEKAVTVRVNLFEKVSKIVNDRGGAFTTDIWTDNTRRFSYLAITFHFVNESNELCDQILCLEQLDVDEKKTSQYLSEVIQKQLTNFGVENHLKKIVFTTDRGRNIVNCFEMIGIDRLNCFDHLINNTTEKVCSLEIIESTLAPVRKLVKFIKITGRNNKFEKTLKSFVKTRWNTNYDMAISVVDNFDLLNDLLLPIGEQNRIREINKYVLKEICDFLVIFKQISQELEGSLYPTLYLVWPAFDRIMKFLNPSQLDSVIMEKMKSAAKEYLTTNFELHKFHRIASFLFPQTKSLKFASQNEKLKTFADVREMFNNFTTKDAASELSSSTSSSSRRTSTESIISSYLDDEAEASEIDTYIAYKVTVDEKIDLIKWWKDHEPIFPVLKEMAFFIHAIPSTSAPSERKFSLCGNISTCLRSSLDPKKVEDLVLLHSKCIEIDFTGILFIFDVWIMILNIFFYYTRFQNNECDINRQNIFL